VAHDWEVNFFTSFFNMLYATRLRRGDDDKRFWTIPINGCLMSYCSIISYFPIIVLISFGGIRLL
jgi:hypothetical protein